VGNRSIKVIDALPDGAIVIRAVWGGVMDEDALIAALASGRLDVAALYGFADEPYMEPPRGFGNVVMTAHMGSFALEGRQILESGALQNLLDELRKLGL